MVLFYRVVERIPQGRPNAEASGYLEATAMNGNSGWFEILSKAGPAGFVSASFFVTKKMVWD
jgi:hypothetical protein